ncbi:MAG TPA: hypothetical protein VJT82_10205, partial [Pyrinomonadaceae bacterium]|nr:hypothetical protein [Pyrinomonadaceae bacterium]
MKMHSMKLAAVTLAGLLASGSASVNLLAAQEQPAKEKDKKKSEQQHTRPRTTGDAAQKTSERLEPDDRSAPPRSDMPQETLANRHESMSEDEAAVVPYYNNFMSTYRLGPEDVISITVFNLDRYSKAR